MAQTKEGAAKVSARKCGLTLEEYQERVRQGMKWCYKCRSWRSVNEFNTDRSRGDGRDPVCHQCRHVPDPYASLRGRVSTFKGRKHTPEAKAKLSAARKGRKLGPRGHGWSLESRQRQSATMRVRAVRGPACHSYKDGEIAVRRGIRFSTEYKQWRYDVFLRDRFTCRKCGDNCGGNLRAHHIKPFADHPELRLDVSNGITLCHTCHELEHYRPDSIRNLRKAKRGKPLY